MTDELKVSAGFRFISGNVEIQFAPGVISVDITGQVHAAAVVALDENREALPMGEVDSPSYGGFENLGTEVVNLANDLTEAAFAVLQPGQVAVLPLGSATPYAWSTATGSTLRYLIIQS